MDGLLAAVNVAVVGIGADEAPAKTVVDRLEAAGHRVLGTKQIAAGAPLLEVLSDWIDDEQIDLVLAVATDTDPVRAAMTPLVTRALPGFGELLRAAAFSEIGSAAMLLDGEAARCGSTYVFVLPATIGAVKVAMDRLLLPQLDLRTRPTNLASKLPRLRTVVPPPDAFSTREGTDPGVAAPKKPITQPPAIKTTAPPPMTLVPPAAPAPRVARTMPPPMPVPPAPAQAAPAQPAPAQPAAVTPIEQPAEAPADTVAADQLGAFVMSLEQHAQKIRREKSEVGPLPVPPSKTQPPARARSTTPPPPAPSKTMPPPIPRKTDAEMKADRDASVAEALSKVEKLPAQHEPAQDEPRPPRKKNETSQQQWAKAADAMEKIHPRAARDTGSLGPASPVLAQGDRVIVIPQHKRGRAWLWLPLALLLGGGAAFGVRTLSGNRTASADPEPQQTVKVESVEALPTPAPAPAPEPAPALPAAGPATPEIEMEAGSAAAGNLTALVQGPAHHAAAPHAGSADPAAQTAQGPQVAQGSAGSQGSADEAPDPRTHPNIAPESPDCDETSCILERYKRECCARFKPAEVPAEAVAPSGPPDTLDKSAVKAGIADLKPAVQQCGEEHYAKGTVKVTLTVTADGRVTSSTVAESPDPTLGTCVAKVLERATFGKTQNGAVFTYPFLF